MSRRVYSVSELLAEVNSILAKGFSGIWVEGEVTNAKPSARGHLYFTLKDEAAAIDCVMWASRASRVRFRVEDGLAALAFGSLTIYAQRGRFQMVVDELEPQGLGALQLAFEQLKARLAKEGLFDDARKRPLPALPQRVGIVTSTQGAAVRDMLKVLLRFPHVHVIVAPAAVQGEGAAAEIARAIERLGGSGLVDVLIVGRGGGSLEDLWAFNEEPVARAIAACPVPVISGVGHQVDFTIADFVADVRAATPTHAAELVVARLEDAARRVEETEGRLARALARHLEVARHRLEALEGSSGLARLPHRIRLLAERLARVERLAPLLERKLERSVARLEAAEAGLRRVPARVAAGAQRRLLESRREQLVAAVRRHLERAAGRLRAGEAALGHLSPRAVLERGYSITAVEGSARPLKDPRGVGPGTVLLTTLARGGLRSVVAGAGAGARRRTAAPARQRGLFDDESGGEDDA